ncbi:uncharacterized protein LOC131150393 [Malania oleifera]|uniref:uncharacterized protein LOC131150393 n=1 Tax=Malania oleifera TaxID=397392 RepID=UPI0025AE1E1A|nr:uncharacterized protein LOC131150393 [Malania oleifera]
MTSCSSSRTKIGKICSPAPTSAVDLKAGRWKKPSTRNPLKDINSIANGNSISSSTSSVSVEAPRGCLGFCLSNNFSSSSSTSSSRTNVQRTRRTLPKTPKSAPNPRLSKPSRSKPSRENLNLPHRASKNVDKAKKNTPSLYQWHAGRKLSSLAVQKPKIHLPKNPSEPPELRLLGVEAGIVDANCTPDSKLDSTLDKAALDSDKKTPPVEVSVSPEIQQLGSSVLSTTTPACYGAGHMLSGVTDKRKCRPRGILTVGDDLGIGKAEFFDSDEDENVTRDPRMFPRVSPDPSPAEASMLWLLSPCNEEDDDNKGNNSCNTASTTTTKITRCRDFIFSPTGLPEFQGFLGSSSLCSSHFALPSRNCNAIVSKEEREQGWNLAGENSPFSIDSLGSENVIQTPHSDSSSDRYVGSSRINADDGLKHGFKNELDSVAEVLQSTSLSPESQISLWDPTDLSFHFPCSTTSPNSIDLTQFCKTLDYQASGISSSSLVNELQLESRISWREGLVSRIFEMDEPDFCRCLSDEEQDNANGWFMSHKTPKLKVDTGNGQILADDFGSPEFFDHEPDIDGKGKEKFWSQRHCSRAESICTDGDGLVASGDSDWNLCYRNQLFEV